MEQIVFARVVAKPGSAEELRQAAEAIVDPSRKEEGNLEYGLFQSTDDEHELWFHARWRDADVLEAHGRSDHVAVWLKVVDEYAVSPVDVTVTRAVA